MGNEKDGFLTTVVKKATPKILVRAFIWLLSLFVAGAVYDYIVNSELRAENKRMEGVNEVLTDSLANTLDSLQFQVTRVGVLAFENDSLRDHTGPIRWKTVYKDTGKIDSIPFIVIETDTLPIPIEIAKELVSCRALSDECKKLKDMNDSLIAFVPTVIDSLEHQIAILDEIASGPKWNLGFIKLPKPQDFCGISAGYGLLNRSITTTTSRQRNDYDDYSPQTSSSDVSRWNIFLGCGIGFSLGIL